MIQNRYIHQRTQCRYQRLSSGVRVITGPNTAKLTPVIRTPAGEDADRGQWGRAVCRARGERTARREDSPVLSPARRARGGPQVAATGQSGWRRSGGGGGKRGQPREAVCDTGGRQGRGLRTSRYPGRPGVVEDEDASQMVGGLTAEACPSAHRAGTKPMAEIDKHTHPQMESANEQTEDTHTRTITYTHTTWTHCRPDKKQSRHYHFSLAAFGALT